MDGSGSVKRGPRTNALTPGFPPILRALSVADIVLRFDSRRWVNGWPPLGAPSMDYFRIYKIGKEGHVVGLAAEVDGTFEEAVRCARHLIGRDGVEVWQGGRRRAVLSPNPAGEPNLTILGLI